MFVQYSQWWPIKHKVLDKLSALCFSMLDEYYNHIAMPAPEAFVFEW